MGAYEPIADGTSTVYVHRANTPDQVARAAANGWGIEVDARSLDGTLFAAHDAHFDPESCPKLESLLAGFNGPLILDFKESGIVDHAVRSLEYAHVPLSRVLAADLIVPDMLRAEKLGLRTLARTSRYERIEGPFYGVWLDYVRDTDDLPISVRHGYLVSPELHGWQLEDLFIDYTRYLGFEGVCTDYPERWAHDRRRHEQRTQVSA